MQSVALYQALVQSLTLPVSASEKQTLIRWLLEDRLGLSGSALLSGKEVLLTPSHFAQDLQRLNQEEPIQYVLGHTQFYGRRFNVNSAVLIPRPETEWLVQLVIDRTQKKEGMRLLDIGTGSGCLAITLALELPQCEAFGLDVSVDALAVARTNAGLHQAPVQFQRCDILTEELPFDNLQVIVSNPPYVSESESVAMAKNVKAYEPHLALFVPDDDPLRFYRSIAQKARIALLPGGLLAVEINERLGAETQDEIEQAGFFDVEVHPDQHGKNRFVTAIAPY